MSFFLLHTGVNLALGKTSLLALQPNLLQDLAIHGFEHVIRRLLKGTKRKRGLSRAENRKLTNRKRRWFVDALIELLTTRASPQRATTARALPRDSNLYCSAS